MRIFSYLLLFVFSISTTLIQGQRPVVLVSFSFLNYDLNTHIAGTGGISMVSSQLYPETGLIHNPALLANDQRFFTANGAAATMLRLNDIDNWTGDLSGSYAFNANNNIGFSISYFDNGNIYVVAPPDPEGLYTTRYYDLSAKVVYSHSFGKGISLGGAIKYCRSDFDNADIGYGYKMKSMNGVAVDIGFSYRKSFNLAPWLNLGLNTGIAATDLGPKVSYDYGVASGKMFLPSQLRVGLLLTPEFILPSNWRIALDVALQADKPMTPSQPEYVLNDDGSYSITKGIDPDVSAFRALYQSFYDSPEGFKGEIDEIVNHAGSELRFLWNNKVYFAIRYGHSWKPQQSGYYSSGAGGLGVGFFGFYMDFFHVLDRPNTYEEIHKNYGFSFGFRGNLSGKMFRF